MISSGLVEFLLYLLIPVVLINFLQGRQSKDNSLAWKKRLSRGDYVVYGSLLLVALGYFISASVDKPPNVFKRIGASPHSLCNELREKLVEYSQSHPETHPLDGIPTSDMKKNREFELLEYYQGSEHGQLDFLVDRFCAYDEDRDAYLKFGEQAFLNSISGNFGQRGKSARIVSSSGTQSEFFSEFADIGLLLYATASTFFVYLPAFVLVGLVTTPFAVTEFAPSRVYVRPWGVIMLCTLLFGDIYWLFTVPASSKLRKSGLTTLWIVSPDSTDSAMFYADASAYTRKLFIAVGLVAFLFMDYMTSSRQTDIQLLKQCIVEQNNALSLSKNHTLLETAVLLSDRLRERLYSLWKREHAAREKVFADHEFRKLYEKTTMETKSKQWVDKNSPLALKSFGIESHLTESSESI
ncbi:hypothetical protein H4S08_004334 [Coemansia sp. RSA 1365]|nr:hypothetical protein H4S08_004334 [Coemansia sp. RSA 1365]